MPFLAHFPGEGPMMLHQTAPRFWARTSNSVSNFWLTPLPVRQKRTTDSGVKRT